MPETVIDHGDLLNEDDGKKKYMKGC